MRRLSLLSAVLSVTLAAQDQPPTRVGRASDFPAFGPSATPGSVFATLNPQVMSVQALQIYPLLDVAGSRVAGQFLMVLTVTRSGGGGTEIMTGTLNTTTAPWGFTETTQTLLPSINTIGLFGGTMTADLLVFVADGQPAQYSVRTSRAQGFPPLKPVGALSGFVDSTVFTWRGADYYVHRDGGGMFVQLWRFDRNRYSTANDPRIQGFWAFLGSFGADPHSPTIMFDQRGEARAVAHAGDTNGAGNAARPFFNGLINLNNAQVSTRFHIGPADASQFAHPGVMAGSTFYAVRVASGAYTLPKRIDVVASCGDTVGSGGGTMRLSAWLPFFSQTSPPPQPWAVLLLVGVPSNGISVPGFRGKLALAPGFVPLPGRLWNFNDLSVDWVVPAPPLPSGSLLWAQTLAYDAAGSFDGDGDGIGDTFYFGNTARMHWQ
jgi:hypothetical protein